MDHPFGVRGRLGAADPAWGRQHGGVVKLPRRLGIRARVAVGFAVVALAVAGTLAGLAYQRTRNVLLDERQDAAVAQTFVNARLVRDGLRSPDVGVAGLLASLSTANRSEPLLRRGDVWYGRTVNLGATDLPGPVRRSVADGGVARQRFVVDGEPLLAVGVPIPGAGADYFEVFPLDDLDRTLRTLSAGLLTGASVAGIGVAAIGWAASRRVLRPLESAASAARRIATGGLGTRIDEPQDRELLPLVEAFNEMAESLAARVERDARFASEVSHELRSPLTSLRTAMDVALTRLPPLDDRARVAMDLVEAQLDRFERMTLDLLEISRIDAGVARLDAEHVDLGACVSDLVEAITNGRVPVEVDERVDVAADVDVGRLEWTLRNLLANADQHGGGAVAVGVTRNESRAIITVDDAGPGIPAADRARIFERFTRAATARSRAGSGLGLALVHEHVRIMGGTVAVEDAPSGGARFVVELPLQNGQP
jgi:signal transduction histidine kinase